jgi:type III secretion protein V
MVGLDISGWLKRFSDVLLAALVIGIIGMMIIPLPTLALDVLLTLNITVAVTLLMVSLYIPNALQIASFPSILLITTLFRLALNISSTRLILLQADAGEVIDSFGNFVVQGNYVVGAVIFLILTLIQFLVIAKGSERVSEVAARFTLDAMPGKQMSIDADLRAGAFDLDEARRRRALVQKESQLYGAMDGAMKFVKGDAIAGIIITSINIVAGIIIGVMQMGMGAGEAAQTYTLLTIGDGLVSQIPALLIATTAGIIVTRVASEDDGSHLGGDIVSQILAQPKALAIAGSLLLILAIIPGLPLVPFLLLATIVGIVAIGVMNSQKSGMASLDADEEEAVEEIEREAEEGARQARALIPAVTPLTLDLGSGLSASIEGERAQWLRERIPSMREGIFFELGVKIPGVRVRAESNACAADHLLIQLDEVPVRHARIPEGCILVNDDPRGLEVFDVAAERAKHPVTGADAAWISADDRAVVEEAGYATWDAAEVIVLEMTAALQAQAHQFVNLQAVRGMLDQLEGPYPAAVQEVVPKLLGLQEVTEVLRRLAEEKISLRNLPAILEILADRARIEKNPVKLTEEVRTGLRAYITNKYSSSDGSVLVYLMEREIEETIQSAVKITETGSFLTLSPDVTREILTAVRKQISGDLDKGRIPILLTDQKVRRYLKRLVAIEFPDVIVLAYQELDPALTIQPLGRITVRAS